MPAASGASPSPKSTARGAERRAISVVAQSFLCRAHPLRPLPQCLGTVDTSLAGSAQRPLPPSLALLTRPLTPSLALHVTLSSLPPSPSPTARACCSLFPSPPLLPLSYCIQVDAQFAEMLLGLKSSPSHDGRSPVSAHHRLLHSREGSVGSWRGSFRLGARSTASSSVNSAAAAEGEEGQAEGGAPPPWQRGRKRSLLRRKNSLLRHPSVRRDPADLGRREKAAGAAPSGGGGGGAPASGKPRRESDPELMLAALDAARSAAPLSLSLSLRR